MAAKIANKVRVVGFVAVCARRAYTRMALKVALRGAEEVGAEAHLIDLRDYQLIFCDGGDSGDDRPKDVVRLCDEVKRAQSILLATPEYHGGYSGVLKNALDLMGFDEFAGKMIGLVGVSGRNMGAFGALSALRSIGRALHAWVVPEQAAIANVEEVFDDEGNCKDEA